MPDDAPGGGDKTFTQADLDRIVQREKAQATAAQARTIAETLGCTVEEAKAKLAAAAEAERAAMTEADRKKAEAEADKQAAAKEKAEAQALKRATMAERALVRAGFTIPKDDDKGEALAYGTRLLGGVAPDADEAAIVAEVGQLKTRFPSLFGAGGTSGGDAGGAGAGGASGGGSGVPSSDAAPPARPGVPQTDWGAAGLERAKARGWVKEPART